MDVIELLAQPREHLRLIHERLRQTFGEPLSQPDGDALGGLIGTVLSQHTSDINSSRADRSMHNRFASWPEIRDAPVAELAESIRSGGLANIKAPRIQAILRELTTRYGAPTIEPMVTLPLSEALSQLRTLPGVGAKTAACVMLFSCGQPAFPVDTHVHRVSRRLGFVPLKASPERVEQIVEAIWPADTQEMYALHVNLIRLGRQVCLAGRPRCASCALADLCRHALTATVLSETGQRHE